MLHRRSPQPRGQLLIVAAVGMVVLMAIAALVLDLGFSWMLHRKEQNAVDPAAIAAARWLRDPNTGNQVAPATVQNEMNAEACFYAQENSFFTDDPGCAAALVAGDLQVHSPPVSGDYAGQFGRVQVIIHDTHPTFFARIWGQTEAAVTTAAVAKNDAGTGNSSTLVALKTTCGADEYGPGGSGGTITGGGTVSIFPVDPDAGLGGYVHVNSSCGQSTDDSCAGSGEKALDINGGSTLVTPFAYTVGSCVENGGGSLQCDPDTGSPCLDEDALPLADPLKNLPEPQIDSFPAGACPDGTLENPGRNEPCRLGGNGSAGCTVTGSGADRRWTCDLEPGVYYAGWDIGSRTTLRLAPGMYIIAGYGIRLQADQGLEAVAADGVDARVTIFSTDGPNCPSLNKQCQGAININAQAAFKAKATNEDSCHAILAAGGPNTCPWKGILLWQDGTVHAPGSDVTLGGGSNVEVAGTIYAPLSNVSVNGGNDTTGCDGADPDTRSCLSIQIISYTWKIDGNAIVDMPYDPSELYQFGGRGLIE